ncbi:UDP-N-acetylmuramoyl-tripeptide--D-alanyl-D-alanine ligase [Catenovulum sp. SM1970]|uniref:UDP-N-acetylmuramoyl-tripeptide--D-alanyl-D- alanine ligase n=1 Tax=Marinifaba aquimaris TaxID=2741323 RepID=UPI00157453A8|nr:UDP-N-acetylmuramoyl-tripeptide--D-alanyl-D-alanine ligase [Marinifaba aquimaris]NTS76591.1 UDP-N-acetylmuramoyl-tripeptide--D-alanyl-D-alanine ligase [Marinifaba aquimaris]
MIPLTLAKVLEITSGKLVCANDKSVLAKVINKVSTDTRTVNQGDLFVALVGERFDAHDFIENASAASALIVEREVNTTVPQIVVKNTLKALGLLGREVKRLADVKTVAITGSCGKTTVKELLAAICVQAGKTHATGGNFNNEIGVPLTLLGLEQSDEYAVIELGANHIGEIAYTVGLTEPDVAMVNNVAGAHLEGFGSLQGVAQAKGEIYGGLTESGTAVVNLDCEFIHSWQSRLDKLQMMAFSMDSSVADVTAENIELNVDANGASQFELNIKGEVLPVKLNLSGQHNIANALAATTCALALGLTNEQIVKGLEAVDSVKGRLDRIQVKANLLAIDDSYNANEASMKAALDVLAQEKGHKIFVMGDMGELAEYAFDAHAAVGQYARKLGIDEIYTLGSLSLHAQSEHEDDKHFSEFEELMHSLNARLETLTEQPVCLLVKGSRSAKMERVVTALQAQQGVSSC